MLISNPSRAFEIPAGTILALVDIHMITRPGAGGYAALFQSSDIPGTTLIRGGDPDTDTPKIIRTLIKTMADKIAGNRAMIICRNQDLQNAISDAFAAFRMIRVLGHQDMAVAEASKHAAIMAERVTHLSRPVSDELQFHRYAKPMDRSDDASDSRFMYKAIDTLVKLVSTQDLHNPHVAEAAQAILDAAEEERKALLRTTVQKITAHDIARPTSRNERRNRS